MIYPTQFFIKVITNMKKGTINLHSPLEEFVVKKCGDDLAYVDNRRDAKQKYGFDFWRDLSVDRLKAQGIEKRLLYSESQQFPDFLFKTRKRKEKYIGGSLIELKDSRGGNIASFNSTIPTKHKSLEEIDIINGNNLVSRIAAIKDGEPTTSEPYLKYERRCFYLIRTHKESENLHSRRILF